MCSTLVIRRLLAVALVCAGPALGTACGAKDSPTSTRCLSTVTSGTSPAAGVLTLTGEFYPDESVILGYDINGQHHTAVGTPGTQRTTLTLIGLPSGGRIYTVLVSCNSGQDDDGSQFFTVQ
jgi:hypothetical protein